MTFAPIKYVVPEVLVEGLTLLAGKPKVGKSWLLLNTAIAVASGGYTLGNLYCTEGDVLYCALEDNERRLQSRITKLLGIAADWPARLFYHTEMPRLAEGGLDRLRDWIRSVPHPRLIIIDTLAMVRAMKQRDESNYASDYARSWSCGKWRASTASRSSWCTTYAKPSPMIRSTPSAARSA